MVEADTEACNKLGLLSEMGIVAGGAGAGAAVGALYNTKFNSVRSLKSQKGKIVSAAKEIKSTNKKIQDFYKNAKGIHEAQLKKLSGSSPLSYQQLRDLGPSELLTKVDKAAKAELEKVVNKTSNSADKALYKKLAEDLSDLNYEKTRAAEAQKVMAKQFPDEYKKLKPHYDKIAELEEKFSKEMDKYSQADEKNAKKFEEQRKTATEKYNKELTKLREDMERTLGRQGSKLRMVNLLKNVGPSHNPRFVELWAKTKENLKSRSFRRAGAKGSMGKAAGIGAAAGTVVIGSGTLAVDIYGNSKDNKNLATCKSELGLVDGELEALQGYQLFGVSFGRAKAVADHSGKCTSLSFVDPEGTIQAIKQKFDNEIPAGTCNLIKNDFRRTEELLSQSEEVEIAATCDNLNAVNGKLKNEKFFYDIDDFHFDAPFDVVSNWPDMKEAKLYKDAGHTQVDYDKTERHRSQFPRQTALETSEGRYDYRDIAIHSKLCADKSNSSTPTCRMFKTALLARVKSAMFREDCIQEELDLQSPTGKEATLEEANEAVKGNR